MFSDFKINHNKSVNDGSTRFHSIIKSVRGKITGGNMGGSFNIPFLFGPLCGSYILTEKYLDIHVTQTPMFVSGDRIKKLFQRIN